MISQNFIDVVWTTSVFFCLFGLSACCVWVMEKINKKTGLFNWFFKLTSFED